MTIEQINDLKRFKVASVKKVLVFDNRLDFIFDRRNYILKPSKIIDFDHILLDRRYICTKKEYENVFEIIDYPEYFIYA